MNAIAEQVQEISSAFSDVLLGFGILFALAQCFFGFKLQKLWIAFIGFLIGFGIGVALILYFVQTEHAGTIAVCVGVVCGILAALAAYRLYRAGIFLLCGFNIFIVIYGLLSEKSLWIGILLGTLAGLAAGILTLKFMRPVIICSTAISGGISAANSIVGLFNSTLIWLPICLGIVIALCGILVQYKTTKA